MEIIKRKGSLALIKDRNGVYWLTRRRKLKHTNRRQKPMDDYRSVRYLPLMKVADSEVDFFV